MTAILCALCAAAGFAAGFAAALYYKVRRKAGSSAINEAFLGMLRH